MKSWLRELWDDHGWIFGLIFAGLCWWGYDLVDDMQRDGIKPVLMRIWYGTNQTQQAVAQPVATPPPVEKGP